MRHLIKDWGMVFVMTMLMLGMIAPAMAADRQGRCKAANINDCRNLTFDTLATVTNSGVLGKANGITTNVIIAFTNTSSETVDIFIQHAQAQEVDGGGVSNAGSTAIGFNPGNSDDYVFVSTNMVLLPFVRIHTEDSDITSNNVQVNMWAW